MRTDATAGPPGREPRYAGILTLSPAEAQEVSERFPQVRLGAPRLLAIAPLLLPLRTEARALLRSLEQWLDLAEELDRPVVVELDDWNFPDPAWAADPDITEWRDWPPADGAGRAGPLLAERRLDWVPGGVTAPPPNLASTKFRSLVHPVFRAVFHHIAKRLRRWEVEGRGALLGGVVVGWESGFYATRAASGRSVRSGFAALTRRGWSKEALDRSARSQGMRAEALFDQLMFQLVQEHVSELSGLAVEAGLPATRVYSHFSAFASVPPERVPPELRDDGRIVPLERMVNPWSRVGLTATPGWADPEEAGERLRALGAPAWGAPEVELVESIRSSEGTLAWLNRLTAAGSMVNVIWGWSDPGHSTYAFRGTTAEQGIARWLDGDEARIRG